MGGQRELVSAQSGDISHSEESWMQTTVGGGPKTDGELENRLVVS